MTLSVELLTTAREEDPLDAGRYSRWSCASNTPLEKVKPDGKGGAQDKLRTMEPF